jgi:hypothetical protein
VSHVVAPTWQGFVGVHAAVVSHALQLPALQTCFVPHVVPFATFVVDAAQTGAPVEQSRVPVTHGFAGVHAAPCWHATHEAAALHTLFVPHVKPAGSDAPASWHTATPVSHAIAPWRQGFVGVQLVPDVHDAQLPLGEHTLSVPHAVPAVTNVDVATHTGAPVEQLTVPCLQRSVVGWHAAPGEQRSHVPAAEHTWPELHA